MNLTALNRVEIVDLMFNYDFATNFFCCLLNLINFLYFLYSFVVVVLITLTTMTINLIIYVNHVFKAPLIRIE